MPTDNAKHLARDSVHRAIKKGSLPPPNSVPCHDCGHVYAPGERRHEYDHFMGYSRENRCKVHAVCRTCHARRTRWGRNDKKSAIEDAIAIDHLGGPAEVMRLLGLTKPGSLQRVHNWMSRGIPPKIKLENPSLFNVSQVQPNDLTDAELIDKLGGPGMLALKLGFFDLNGYKRVHNWMTRGIPPKIKLEHPKLFRKAKP